MANEMQLSNERRKALAEEFQGMVGESPRFRQKQQVVAYYPNLNRITGNINATLMLCQMLYWEGKGMEELEGWQWRTVEEWKEQTGLSRDQQQHARKVLVRKGLIEEDLRGFPKTVHYLLDHAALLTAWSQLLRGNTMEDKEDLARDAYGQFISESEDDGSTDDWRNGGIDDGRTVTHVTAGPSTARRGTRQPEDFEWVD